MLLLNSYMLLSALSVNTNPSISSMSPFNSLPQVVIIEIACWLDCIDCISLLSINCAFNTLAQSTRVWVRYHSSKYHYYKQLIDPKLSKSWYHLTKQIVVHQQKFKQHIDLIHHTFKLTFMQHGAAFASDGNVLIKLTRDNIDVYFIYTYMYKFKSIPLPTSIMNVQCLHYNNNKIIIHANVLCFPFNSGSESLLWVIDIHTNDITTIKGQLSKNMRCIAVTYPLLVISKQQNLLMKHMFSVFNLQTKQFVNVPSNIVAKSLQSDIYKNQIGWYPYDLIGIVGRSIWFKHNQNLYKWESSGITTLGYDVWRSCDALPRSSQHNGLSQGRDYTSMTKQIQLFKNTTLYQFVTLQNNYIVHHYQCLNGYLSLLKSNTHNIRYYCRHDGLCMIHCNKYHNITTICV